METSGELKMVCFGNEREKEKAGALQWLLVSMKREKPLEPSLFLSLLSLSLSRSVDSSRIGRER